MLRHLIVRATNTGFDRFYAWQAAKVPMSPEGVLRVRYPASVLISVTISALMGIVLSALTISMILRPAASSETQNVWGMVGSFVLLAFAFYALAVWLYLCYRNIYVETSYEYVEHRNTWGRITRIYYSEIDSYSYTYEYQSKILTLVAGDGRKISFRPALYRGARVLAVLAFRVYNSRWPDPSSSADQQIVQTQADSGVAQKALWEEIPEGRNLLIP